ncbi:MULTISPECIES: hypothetical protein [unclassified Aeromonas]|uniref:hypothetical protein n=1 Tax=unclassified Aeromonas TaxID=257493 RepID=UPI0022E97377|nr:MULTISPECIES: hypothetical protein [unclassified Aeromonas]
MSSITMDMSAVGQSRQSRVEEVRCGDVAVWRCGGVAVWHDKSWRSARHDSN